MTNYVVEYEKKNIMMKNSTPHGPYLLYISAGDFAEAARRAIPKLIQVGFFGGNNDIWNAKIIGPKKTKRPYEILRKGAWLVDRNTGQSLEEKL